MRKTLLSIACIAVTIVGTAGHATAKSPCTYKGKQNALPTAGLPIYVYADGDMSPSGYVGVGDGTSDNYGQIGGDSSGAQAEGRSKAAGESGYVNTGASYGSC